MVNIARNIQFLIEEIVNRFNKEKIEGWSFVRLDDQILSIAIEYILRGGLPLDIAEFKYNDKSVSIQICSPEILLYVYSFKNNCDIIEYVFTKEFESAFCYLIDSPSTDKDNKI